jgi:hypothetical protein
MPAMQGYEFIESESAMNTGSDCVLATQKNELGRAIKPPMSTGLMPSTVAGSDGQPVRKRERTDRTNCGRENAEMGMTPTPPRPTCGLLEAGARGCSPSRTTAAPMNVGRRAKRCRMQCRITDGKT